MGLAAFAVADAGTCPDTGLVGVNEVALNGVEGVLLEFVSVPEIVVFSLAPCGDGGLVGPFAAAVHDAELRADDGAVAADVEELVVVVFPGGESHDDACSDNRIALID